MKIQWKKLIACLAIPLVVGGVSSLLTGESMETFQSLNKPPLAPPGWLFPVVWTILFVLMGIASYLVFTAGKDRLTTRAALTVYGIQLAVNFFWPVIFFNLGAYLFAFLWLILLWVLILATAILFYQLSKPAAWLLIPYLIWVTFAGYLNFGVFILN